MTTEPEVRELLAPLTDNAVDPSARRFQVDREKIVSRMVEVSLAPEARFGARARVAGLLALAAGFLLASWGGLRLWQQSSAVTPGIEVVALRGGVTSVQGPTVNGLGLGKATRLRPQGTLETAAGAEARIKTESGIEIELLEGSLVALGELGGAGDAAALRLERGRVRCIVAHQPGRTFSVLTAAARVIDVGTIFTVGVETSDLGPTTRVQVEEGEVLVQHGGEQSRLGAAQSWTSATEPRKSVAVASPVDPSVDPSIEPARAVPGPRHELLKRRPETLAAETKLLRSGLASEQKGDLQGAAKAFESLLGHYPDSQLAPDAKAALSRVKGRLESSK